MTTQYTCVDDFIGDIMVLGNHHHCGMFLETFEERGNEMLRQSNVFLQENHSELSVLDKMKMKCWQFCQHKKFRLLKMHLLDLTT